MSKCKLTELKMSRSLQSVISVQNYLEGVSSGVATKREVMEALGISGCTFDRAIKTLRSRNIVEVAGKKGKANLYRIKK